MFAPVAEKSHEIQVLAMQSVEDCLRKERVAGPLLKEIFLNAYLKRFFKTQHAQFVICLNVGIL